MDATGGITSPVSVQRSFYFSSTLYGCTIYHGVGVIFCLFITEVFLGPKQQTGRVRVHALFVSLGQVLTKNPNERIAGSIISDFGQEDRFDAVRSEGSPFGRRLSRFRRTRSAGMRNQVETR